MTQFAFLRSEFSPVFVHARKAEDMALSDPRGACFYARLALETAVKWMYAHDADLRTPYRDDLSALIHTGEFRTLVGNGLVTKARIIKDLGNRAVHDQRTVAPASAITVVRELFHFSYWLVRSYGRGEKPEAGLTFSQDALPRIKTMEAKTYAAYRQAADQYLEKDKAQKAAEKARVQTEAEAAALKSELKKLKAEIAVIRKANEARPDSHDYNEAQTRDAFIDLLLHEAGWPLNDERDREYPVTGMPSDSGKGFVDYVLWGKDGKPLAVIEAKRTRRDARVGQQQAKLYADCLEQQFGRRPVIYYTNGYEHWLWDDVEYPPRAVQGFLKRDELELLHQRRKRRKLPSHVDIDMNIAGRFYQTRAIRRIDEVFEKEKHRKALLEMATGSGKTRTVIALIDQLMRAGWVKRALFLADRVALVKQAVGAFKTHLPDTSPVNLISDKEAEGRIYVSTYPTMVGLIDQVQNGVRRFGAGHFDLIVIDEAHRSVYRKYEAIFDYFDSLLVGLTATPRTEIDHNTYGLFDLEKSVPTDSYDLEEAVSDGFLTPPEAISVPLKFQREGIKYDDLSEEEKEDWDEIEWTEDGEASPREVGAAAINKWLFNKDTVDKVLKHLMTHGIKVNEGDRLGKTIIFAKNHEHAAFIQERFDINYPHLAGHFARVIDFKTEYAQSMIDDFSEKDKDPHIAISVDMLDTGIDVPEVVNLVFFKIVRSKTKFWQMIGRGTRLCPDLFGPGQHKEKFLVFDYCQNFEFFNENPDFVDGASSPSLGEKLFTRRVELIGELQALLGEEGPAGFAEPNEDFEDRNTGAQKDDADPLDKLHDALIERLFAEVTGMNLDNFIVRPKRKTVEKFQERIAWNNLTNEARTELVENLAGLPSAFEDDELEARQFDHLLLQTQLAVLRVDAGLTSLQAKIMSVASKLEELGSIPLVNAQMALILDVQTDEYWQDITLPMLEQVRKRLRKLMHLIEKGARKIIYTDFEDEIGEAANIDLPSVSTGTDKARFLMKVRHFLENHTDHISIQKLRRNEQLTQQDLLELESIFMDEAVGTEEDLKRIREGGGLGFFVRSLVGLSRDAAKQALGGFMEGRTLTANQIEFVNQIIDHLTEQGSMAPERLYESPFTDLDDQGVSGVFSTAEVTQLVKILNNIKARAAA